MRFSAIAVFVLLATSVLGQVRPVYSSIESHVANAKLVCVGKICKIVDVKVQSYKAIELTIDVSETLKGQPQKTIKAHRYNKEDKAKYEAIQKASADSVWIMPPGDVAAGFPKDTARIDLCLEPSLSDYRQLGGLAIGMDFTILRTRQELIGRIRQFLKENPNAKGGTALLTPVPGQSLSGFVDFLVPTCPWAEKLAIRMITKPESFKFSPPKGNPYEPGSEPIWEKSKEGMLRTEGLILLQHFPSESNIRLAKRYLDDGLVTMKQTHGKPITTYYWVRDAAFHLLTHWKVVVDRPLIDGPPMANPQGPYLTDGSRIANAFRQL